MKPRISKVRHGWICYRRNWGGEQYAYGATPISAARAFFRKYPDVRTAP